MQNFKKYWASQFAFPHGFGGKIATFIMNRLNGAMYKAVVKNAPTNGRILDVGFGNGVLIKRLAKRTGGGIYGIDISPDMVSAASKRNKKFIKSERVTLSLGSVEKIPFECDFNFVYTVNTVYFWDNLAAGYSQIASKLSNGGVFINVCYTREWLDKLRYTNYGFKKYQPEQILKAAGDAGLSAEIVWIARGKSYYIKTIKQGEIACQT